MRRAAGVLALLLGVAGTAQTQGNTMLMDLSCAAGPALGYRVDWPACIKAMKDVVKKQNEDYQHRIHMLEAEVRTLQIRLRTLEAEIK